MVRRRLLVSGLVQGVWYRESCRQQAELLGLGGWVRNLADGRVEVVAEGSPEAVAALARWAGAGPPRAEVVDVEAIDEDPQGERAFTVR